MVQAAEEGAGLDDSGDDIFPDFAGVTQQLNIAFSVWLDSGRQTLGRTYGWYSYDGISDGSWKSWRPQNADGDWNLGAFCCYPGAFQAAPVSTTTTTTTSTTTTTTMDPTADPTTPSTVTKFSANQNSVQYSESWKYLMELSKENFDF